MRCGSSLLGGSGYTPAIEPDEFTNIGTTALLVKLRSIRSTKLLNAISIK